MRDDSGAGEESAPRANILLVDDQRADLLALEAILADLGQNVVAARSGDDALRLLLQEDFAVILLDVQMPGLDGFAVAQQIRGRERTRHTPIIFLSAYDARDFPVERAYELGAIDYLQKPISPTILRAKTAVFVDLFQKTELLRRLERREFERRLAEANDSKDQCLVMLAHELRNPLAPLQSSLYVLGRDEAVQGRHSASLGRMERQVRRIERMVEDLLGASEVVHGRVRLRMERLDLSRLVRTAVEDRRPLLEQAGLIVRVEAPDTPVWVQGDADRLAQVLDDLLDNEVKFVERGGRVTLRLATVEGEPGTSATGAWAILTLSDDGIGVAPEMLERLFDVFAQADRSLDRRRGGLGLGLAVVKGLVELHGGLVRAESAGLGRGSTFTVRLPLEPEPAALSPTSEPPRQTGVSSRVVVIEDNHDAALSLRMLLEVLGHEVRVAFTGREGLSLALGWRPDVVLSDIGLPELDGYEVARRLRQEPDFSKVLLVAITGYNGEEDRRRSREAGFDYHLGKPADVRELQRVLMARAS